MVVGVGLVPLEHGELGVVRAIHPLVAEVVADLVDPLEPAHEQPLEVELVGDAQVERHVERVVVGHEGPGRGAAVERLEDRASRPRGTRASSRKRRMWLIDARADAEDLAHLGMHREVGVALAVAHLGIARARRRPLVPSSVCCTLPRGSGRSALGEQRRATRRARVTSPVRVRNSRAADADVIVEVEQLHHLERRRRARPGGSRAGPARSRPRGARRRSCPAGGSATSRPGDGDRRAVIAHGVDRRPRAPRRRCGSARSGRRTARRPSASEPRACRAAPPRRTCGSVPLGHAALLPKRLRYASMNASRSPSMTRCTSPSLSSVRWSLTMV